MSEPRITNEQIVSLIRAGKVRPPTETSHPPVVQSVVRPKHEPNVVREVEITHEQRRLFLALTHDLDGLRARDSQKHFERKRAFTNSRTEAFAIFGREYLELMFDAPLFEIINGLGAPSTLERGMNFCTAYFIRLNPAIKAELFRRPTFGGSNRKLEQLKAMLHRCGASLQAVGATPRGKTLYTADFSDVLAATASDD